ncbi:MAG: alpha-glucan family phosphorylase [Paludibacteraceae bacterium]|nr:alpha-glucan family phosphorylase [Paludibacteraceae bacterium]
MKLKVSNANYPNWRPVTVKFQVPKEFQKLMELSKNLWWVWNDEAIDLFTEMNPQLWNECQGNPVLLLQKLKGEDYAALAKNTAFMNKMNDVYTDFKAYMAVKPVKSVPSVAYFSMEYGLTSVIKIYSGGLGVLAGDYLKEASDCAVDMVAVGFLYRYGYFTQSLSMNGEQIAVYDAQIFDTLPIEQITDKEGKAITIAVPYPGRNVYANLWRVNVGRVQLILLDTDIEQNSEQDRTLTYHLYGGDNEHRLKQEILLGIGGIYALNALGIKKDIYHCNEGHAAFLNVQRLLDYMKEDKLSFNEALEVVRSTGLFTTHTPVPAGHDKFDEQMFQHYMNGFAAELGLSWSDFMNMGREVPGDLTEKFSVTVFACNTCQEVNGVSWLHGKVSQNMFKKTWDGYFPEELHVSWVTNGVHYGTWAAKEWKQLHSKYFGDKFYSDQSNLSIWENIYNVPDEEIWKIRTQLKGNLIEFIKTQFSQSWLKNQGDPSRIVKIMNKINPNALTIGFGRRFATYKRAHLLFTDLERLDKIVNNPNRPVQFIFTGKAHPADAGGQKLIQNIIEISRRPEFLGKVIFLENYDMALAKKLISGVDIWLNTPTRPLEASGTSGEKAQMNGVLNFSVLDGWWYEGYKEGAGWALTDKRTYTYQPHQDQLDAATIYSMLENEIVPLFYDFNSSGFSPRWIQYIKNSFAKITPTYTTKRMLDDYIERFYNKEGKRSKSLKANNFAKAKEIVAWKEKVASIWDDIEICDIYFSDQNATTVTQSTNYEGRITIDVKDPSLVNSFGVEYVATQMVDGVDKLFRTLEFKIVKTEGTKVTYQLVNGPKSSGSFKCAFRLFPKNADLPHRMDFCYVRWF